MLATDPLSLLLLGCALFSGLFLVATLALGAGHAHVGHLGHAGHLGHLGHLGDAGHLEGGHSAASAHDATTHTPTNHTGAQATPTTTGESLLGAAQSLLLGSLNLNGALIFLLVFGVLGYLLHNGQGASLLTVVVVAAFVGALAAIGVNAALTRIFITSQAGELPADSSRLEGRLASVSIAIRAQGLGEVVYSGEAGARHSIGARSSDGDAISVGTQVVIVATEQGLATVQPWEGFLAETRQRLSVDQPGARLAPAGPPGDAPQPSA
jgi:membrane protein implicated in regulation of membrane protease activity